MAWRKVDSRVWSDGWFLGLSDDARMLWLYLLTCQHWAGSLPGLFRCHSGTAAGDLGWEASRYSEAFGAILESGRVEFDKRTGLLWIVRAHEYCSEKHHTRDTYWPGLVSSLPECPLREKAWEKIRSRPDSPRQEKDLSYSDHDPISDLRAPISNLPSPSALAPDCSPETPRKLPGDSADSPAPALMPDSRHMGAERDILLEVCAEFGAAWGCTPPDMPTGDNQRRFLAALRDQRGGRDVLLRAVKGHHAAASRDGSKIGREVRHVVPPATDHGAAGGAQARHGPRFGVRERVKRSSEDPLDG